MHNVFDPIVAESYLKGDSPVGLQNIASRYYPASWPFLHKLKFLSYEVLFMYSLLGAASLQQLDQSYHTGAARDDNLSDMVFNVRDNQTGLNLNFMSYTSYKQSGSDPSALLDQSTFMKQT
jgi:hypothetical protein